MVLAGSDSPLRVLPPILFGIIVYPLCDLHEGRMWTFIGALLLLNTTASAMYAARHCVRSNQRASLTSLTRLDRSSLSQL